MIRVGKKCLVKQNPHRNVSLSFSSDLFNSLRALTTNRNKHDKAFFILLYMFGHVFGYDIMDCT